MRTLTALLTMTLVCGTAFAGTATYVGTHTASDARIGDSAPSEGNMVVEYAGATINFSADGSNSGQRFPDGAGGLISFGTSDFVITLVIESATLPDFNLAPIAYAIYANQGDAGTFGGARADTPNNAGTTDAWAYLTNDDGTYTIAGSRALYPDLTLDSPNITSPVTFPVTLTIERSDSTNITISAVDAAKAVLDLGTSTVDAADIMYPRLFFFDPNGASDPGTSMSISLAQLSGDSVPDVNLPEGTEQNASVSSRVVAGDSKCFDVTNPGTAGVGEFTWTFDDGQGGGPVALAGELDGQLCFEPLTEAHAGTYVATFDDGDEAVKVANTFTLVLEVLPEGTPVPASTNWMLFITMLAILLSGAALMYGRKKGLNAKG